MKHNFTRQIAPNWLWTQIWLWDNRGANANYVRKELPCRQCYLWCAICNLVIFLVDCFPFLLLSKSTLCMIYGHKHTEKMRAMVNDLRCRLSKSTCENICWSTGKTMIFFSRKGISKLLCRIAFLKSLCCKGECCRESCDCHLLLGFQAIYKTVYLNSSLAKERVFQNLSVQGSQLSWMRKAKGCKGKTHLVECSSNVLQSLMIFFKSISLSFEMIAAGASFISPFFSQYMV